MDARFGTNGPQSADIVIAVRSGTGFARLGESADILRTVNTDALEYAACISADGLTILFNRARTGVGGGVAIHMATRTRTSEAFGVPARLVDVDGFVEGATFAPDEKTIYYHKREGTRFVIYRARQ